MSILTTKQLDVIGDLFQSGGDEAEVLKKHKISYQLWRKWLNNTDFNRELVNRFEASKRQSMIILAKYVPLAAAKLVQLCDSEKEETSRKACLDILSLQNASPDKTIDKNDRKEPLPKLTGKITPAKASKLLAVLAEK